MPEFDYAGWVARAREFVVAVERLRGAENRSAAVAEPASEAEVRMAERALGLTLPEPLRGFFRSGAAGLDCAYALEPEGDALERLRAILPDETAIYGGARLGSVEMLAELSKSVGAWAEDTWIAESADQRSIWATALPFASLDNGDYLALDLRSEKTDPPVVYLNHDDESFLVAPNFLVFLDAWERLCYLGPEHWLLEPFIGTGGYLDASSDRAVELRALFGR